MLIRRYKQVHDFCARTAVVHGMYKTAATFVQWNMSGTLIQHTNYYQEAWALHI